MDAATRLSKTLSYWLRHRPDAAALTLDRQGWADVRAVLDALNAAGTRCGPDGLHKAVVENGKQRFELSADGQRIRARQGHSIAIDLGLQPLAPPKLLYHGTVAPALDRIMAEGLRPMQRQHVHLSPDLATARLVGARRGPPVILSIRARDLHERGTRFFLTANSVWLTEAVPPEFIVAGEPAAPLT